MNERLSETNINLSRCSCLIYGKKCTKCRIVKSKDNFYKHRSGRLFSHCKDCVSKQQAVYYADNKKHITKRNRERYQINKKQVLLKCKEYRKNNKTMIKEKDKLRKAKPEFKKSFLIWLSDWRKQKRKTDVQFAIREKLRKSIWARLKKAKVLKKAKTIQLLGCSFEQFKKHIEHLWDVEMSWENHGVYWQIDHIRPLSSFDLTKKDEQLKAFHFSNTQPLTSLENLKKGNKWNSQDLITKK